MPQLTPEVARLYDLTAEAQRRARAAGIAALEAHLIRANDEARHVLNAKAKDMMQEFIRLAARLEEINEQAKMEIAL